MDPDACLKEIRELTRSITDPSSFPETADTDRLAELIQALDRWISTGGALPREWALDREPNRLWKRPE